ncbi:MAG: hypothetical protein KF823_10830 [Xanthomonadales bacterium]|nr:hypothetical protein [Xanthomonadales bacterium]
MKDIGAAGELARPATVHQPWRYRHDANEVQPMTQYRSSATPRAKALTLIAVGLAPLGWAQASNQPATLAGPGPFVFGQVNELVADQYMLDTRTGRLWRLVDTADGTGSVLEPVPYALPDGSSQPLPPDAQPGLPVPADLVPVVPPGR